VLDLRLDVVGDGALDQFPGDEQQAVLVRRLVVVGPE